MLGDLKLYKTKYDGSDIPNPLPGLVEDFVGRMRRGGRIYIRPILPKPDELGIFAYYAREKGFTPGPDICWGGSVWAPGYWWREEHLAKES